MSPSSQKLLLSCKELAKNYNWPEKTDIQIIARVQKDTFFKFGSLIAMTLTQLFICINFDGGLFYFAALVAIAGAVGSVYSACKYTKIEKLRAQLESQLIEHAKLDKSV